MFHWKYTAVLFSVSVHGESVAHHAVKLHLHNLPGFKDHTLIHAQPRCRQDELFLLNKRFPNLFLNSMKEFNPIGPELPIGSSTVSACKC